MKWRTLVTEGEDGWFVVECPALPGCISQGRTREEVLRNIAEAIDAYLDSLQKHGEPIPPPVTEEIVEVPCG
jgi:antitoxin HicB